MTVVTRDITFQTKGNCDIIDVTSQVANAVEESELNNGIITLFISGSTAGVTTIEYEPRLVSDFTSRWERVIPQNIPYEHAKTWGEGNGHSHVRSSVLGASLIIPFVNKRLALGTWQQIVFVDFDHGQGIDGHGVAVHFYDDRRVHSRAYFSPFIKGHALSQRLPLFAGFKRGASFDFFDRDTRLSCGAYKYHGYDERNYQCKR